MKTKLVKFGFEIEGEYSEDFRALLQLSRLGDIKGDGSVHLCQNIVGFSPCKFPKGVKPKTLYPREFASVAFPISSMKPVKDLFRQYQEAYERGEYHWNSSAGFHVHTSYEPQMPFEIFSTRFHKFFLDKLKQIFPEEYEARKDNRFCRTRLTSRELIRGRYINRYKAINFLPALSRHGTVEFRIFPTAEPKKMLEYLLFTLGTIQEYITGEAEKKLSVKRTLYIPSDLGGKVEVVASSTIRSYPNTNEEIKLITKENNVQIIHS